ncbi:formate dehydrogenase subunit alpha [Phycisphaeraceae bacterium D3-23]
MTRFFASRNEALMAGAQLTVDGKTVTCPEGKTLLDLARCAGVDIPTLCHDDQLAPEGGCRLCLVQVQGAARPVAACHTQAKPGMVVQTKTEEIEALRRQVLGLIVSELDPSCDTSTLAFQGSRLQALMQRYRVQIPESAQGDASGEEAIDDSHTYLRLDRSKCITCRLCVNACDDIQGQSVFGIGGRGGDVHLLVGGSDRFSESPCVACGACVDHCPTGALTDVDHPGPTSGGSETDTVCGYCGVGCRVAVTAQGGRVAGITGIEDAAVNAGHLCAKGRFAHAWQHHPDRLKTPLLRRDGRLEAVSWRDAIAWLARRIGELRRGSGPDSIGLIASSRSTNESAYLMQKMARAVIGTNNIDCCARVCHASTALGLRQATGAGAASASYADIERANCIVVVGANPTEAHPVIGARIKQAVRSGTPLIVIDPRSIELAEYAQVHLALRPAANVELLNAIALRLISADAIAHKYLDERCEGYEELARFLLGRSMDFLSEASGVERSLVESAADLLGSCGPVLFVHGLGLSEQEQGTDSIRALCNLGMLTGSIGIEGAGMLPLRGQNNVQGAADMGCMPALVTGYQSLEDEEVRRRLQNLWGVTPPFQQGLTIPEMLDAAAAGQLRGMWVMGEDLAHSEPNQNHAVDALKQLDLLVVQDLFLCETAKLAHLVLPVAGCLESDGTYTNGERRVQRVRPACQPPGEAWPDWRVVLEVAREMGEDWSHESSSEIMDEIAATAPALFGGMSFSRLTGDGIQWPCPEADHPGTATMHHAGFLRGKGKLACVEHRKNPEPPGDDYPFTLITGRVLQHYNTGTMTRRTDNIQLTATDRIDIHPQDADAIGLHEGDDVRVASRWGETRVKVHLSGQVAGGTVFMSFHDAAVHTNRLVGPWRDPESNCPAYKATAVSLVPVGVATKDSGFLVRSDG